MPYETVIGLEVHIQEKTLSKMFCSCPNSFGQEPNTAICPVCMGYPGVLPVPNHKAIKMAVMAGLLTNCSITPRSKFDRKSYFYPDMPKNYQISQYDLPFCAQGEIKISGCGFSGKELPVKTIGITRIHLEEDVAKLTHFPKYSGIDYNRAGIPLLEVVSEPDMRSPDEAYAYLTALKEIIQYGGISDCDMEKGQMRCDVNISLRKSSAEKLGVKVELKNLNSFRAVHRAIAYEALRQSALLDSGKIIIQETRGWNDDEGQTYSMRLKESAHDYRYFPDPDLMPISFSDNEISDVKAQLPETPAVVREKFIARYGLSRYEAEVLTSDKHLASYFEALTQYIATPKTGANWVLSELLSLLSEKKIDIEACPLAPKALGELINAIENGTINARIAKEEVIDDLFQGNQTVAEIIRAKNLVQLSDETMLEAVAVEVIAENPKPASEFRQGNEKALQFLVGQVMKKTKGRANPQIVVCELKKHLK